MSRAPLIKPERPAETATEPRVEEAGTRVSVRPVANDVEGSLREASAAISRAASAGEQAPADQRAAAEAYNAQAVARDELARQQQGNGARTLDVLA
jgi:hypothetical protein